MADVSLNPLIPAKTSTETQYGRFRPLHLQQLGIQKSLHCISAQKR